MEAAGEFGLLMPHFQQFDELALAPHAIPMVQMLDQRYRVEQRGDFGFLLAAEVAGPVLDLAERFLQPRALALFDASVELVFVREFPVVFRELLLQCDYLFGRQRRQYLDRVAYAAVDDDAVARLETVDEPGDVLRLQAVLRLVDGGSQERLRIRAAARSGARRAGGRAARRIRGAAHGRDQNRCWRASPE